MFDKITYISDENCTVKLKEDVEVKVNLMNLERLHQEKYDPTIEQSIVPLTFDEEKGGYYRDYASDNLSMHFVAKSNGVTSMDDDYSLSSVGNENILVETIEGKIKITNNFILGSMPFPVIAIMDQNELSGIKQINIGFCYKNFICHD